MMYDEQQSDGAVLARKAANKGEQFPAEPLERRAAAERHPKTLSGQAAASSSMCER